MAQITLNSSGVASNGTLKLQSNGTTDAVTIDTSQNVGIGTTSPSNRLSVVSASGSDGFISISSPTTDTAGFSVNGGTDSNKGAIVRFQKGASTKWTMGTDSAIIGGTSDNFHLYSGGANAILFSTNASERMRLDANGKLLVGGTTSDLSSSSQAMIIGSGGLSVQYAGTTDTYLKLTPGAANGVVDIRADARSGGYPAMTFTTSAAERARIDSSGNLLVGKTTQGLTTAGFEVRQSNAIVGATASPSTNADTNYHLYSTGAGAYRFYVGYGGTVYATSTTISAISDIRFKENVRDLNVGLAEVMALKPRVYDWKEGKGADIKNARGFIAQEFEEVFPDLIDEWKDPAPEGEEPYKSVRADLIPVLVKAMQQQQAIIETLTARITALEQA